MSGAEASAPGAGAAAGLGGGASSMNTGGDSSKPVRLFRAGNSTRVA